MDNCELCNNLFKLEELEYFHQFRGKYICSLCDRKLKYNLPIDKYEKNPCASL